MIHMKKALTGLLILLAGFLPGRAGAQNGSKTEGSVKIGVARVNITPGIPAMMSGYEARKTPSVGVQDSLYASAFYFTREKERTILITADIIAFNFEMTREIRSRIHAKTGIPEKNIMLVAAHNHGGPATGFYEASVKAYTGDLLDKLTDLAALAVKNPQPFLMGVGKGYCDLNINRRAEFSKGEIWLGRNAAGPVDRDLSVVRFETLGHKPIAVLVNWPCHGTVTGDTNYMITGDWLGAAARYLRNEMGDQVVVGVTAGASGDINSIYGPNESVFKEVDAVGYHVGEEALRVMEKMIPTPVETLQSDETVVKFPGKQVSPDRYPRETYDPAPDTEVRFSAMRLGSLVLAGISGELFTEMGMAIKEQSPYTNTLVLTHCNGSSGYICTDGSYITGGYEIKVTRIMPGNEEKVIRSSVGLIQSLQY